MSKNDSYDSNDKRHTSLSRWLVVKECNNHSFITYNFAIHLYC